MARKILRAAARLTACALGGVLLFSGAAPAAEEAEAPLRVIFLDVGKGDCILLAKGESRVLIDTGYAETANDVIAALRQEGTERLDALIITHYDKDHAGGARAVLEKIPTGQVYLPGYDGDNKYYEIVAYTVQANSLPAVKVKEDVSFRVSGVDYEIFASPLEFVPGIGKEEGNDNDVSLVVAARQGQDSLLFAGDIEKEGISAYLAAGHGTFDVVKMPHHGQNESNSDDFIDQVRMKIAVVTDDAEEPMKKKMIKQLGAVGAEIYSSAANGRITVTCTGNGTYEVTTER